MIKELVIAVKAIKVMNVGSIRPPPKFTLTTVYFVVNLVSTIVLNGGLCQESYVK